MRTETLTQCPACSSTELKPFKNITDYYYSKETFQIVECGSCGLRFTQNRPAAEDIGQYYDSSNYASHDSGKKASAFLKVYQLARDYMLGQKFELIRQFKPEWKKVLDYGTGEGFFVEYLLKKGKEATGIEPSALARENFKSRTGKELYADIDAVSSEKKFHVISLWHVLEHIHELRTTMMQLTDMLESNGVMVIAVPNQNSKDIADFGDQWAAWDVPRHLYHWDISSLGSFMKSLGLEQIHVGQLPLDPLYIGMISARYANQSAVSGIWKGIQSYFHGKSNRDQGSTLLTVWMKK